MPENTSQPYVNPYYKPVFSQEKIVKVRPHQESYSGVLVIQEQKAEVERKFWNQEKPEVPFDVCFFLVNHDPRLTLSSDTYVQMIMGAGLRIKIKQKNLNKSVNKWADDINLERKIENALSSYVDCGNMMFEKAPKMADISEVDMSTIAYAKREKNGEITKYVQEVNNKEISLEPKDLIHFKLTNSRKEVWGRGLYHSLFAEKTIGGISMDSPLVSQWMMEDAMVKIFNSYASPMMMIHFKDAGEQWIKKQEEEFRKMKQGAKILTDKEFEAKIFEVAPQSKFDKYVDHRQSNLMEPGSQFPLGFFNADFTNKNASETADSVWGRKVKRIQKKLALQIKEDIIIPYIKSRGNHVEESDISVMFEIESKSEVGNQEMVLLFEKGVVTRSEFRKHLVKKTTVELDEDDMVDTPPITSVTPTNDMRTTQPSPASQDMTPIQQQDQIAKMQQQVEMLMELVKEKIPNPRGRPKKE